MSTTLPPTEPMSPMMRQTLELLKWAAEGFANANRVRRARLSGAPEFSGAEAMEMYLKSQGIDIPRLDEVLRGLMADGTTAAAVKEVADLVSDAAVRSPKDLSDLVQRLASAATGTVPQPSTTPAAAPPGATWTVTPSGKLKFRPEHTMAAQSAGVTPAGKPRFRPEYTSAACSSGVTPHTPQTSDPPAPAANERLRAEPPLCADVASPASAVTAAASCACTDAPSTDPATAAPPPSPTAPTAATASEVRISERLDALERRLDVFEVDQAREFTALRQWMTEQFRGLSDLLAGSAAASHRMTQEHEALGQRVQQLEAALVRIETLDAKLTEESSSASSSEPAGPDNSAPAEPDVAKGIGLPQETGPQAEPAGASPEVVPEVPTATLHEGAAAQQGETVAPVGDAARPVDQAHDTCLTDQETPPARPVDEDARPQIDGTQHDVTHPDERTHDKLPAQQGDKLP